MLNERKAQLPSAAPVQGEIVRRYFLDRSGVPTKRMGSAAGKGHYDIAKEVLGVDQGELYGRMAELGYARVAETDREIHVEAKTLTKNQQRFLKDRSAEMGAEVVLNDRMFVESKDSRAGILVRRLVQ